MKIPKLMSLLTEAGRADREKQLAAPDPRTAPQAYLNRYKELHRKNLTRFLCLTADERREALELLERDAALLLVSDQAESIRRGVTMMDTIVAWERLSRDAA